MRNVITKKLREGYEFKTLEYLSQGWEIYKSNWLQYTIAILIFSILTSVLSLIPLGGVLIMLLASPLFEAGCFIVANKQLEGEQTTLQDFLSGNEHIGGLVMAAFLYLLIIFGVVFILALSLSVPVAVLIKTYDFSNGFFSSGALFPAIGLGLAAFLIILAFLIVYIYAYQYVVFGQMEGSEAIGTSRKIAMRQFGKTFLFIIIFSILGVVYSGSIMYLFGVFEPISQIFQAALNNDLDAIRDLQNNVNYLPQIAASVLASLFTPYFYCVRQVAFRDINEMDRKDDIDNTIEHLIA